MKLKEVQKLSIQLNDAICSLNKKMPDNFCISVENDGSLLVTNEITLAQTLLDYKPELLDKEYLTKKDIEDLFKIGRF
ncbi:hypothetical protein CBE90_04650 [Pasteurella multocida]|uniref:hypothetical protein n=1 Tax=Pasteurella multocida TaxID=747 RepID=UPI000CE8DB7A|nr:hypothetical protein [Pasteurella multocida]PPE94929.1 hypothetical protein CBE90_04650 [Pasteurella multocida]PPE95049.1 hypothetical protein CBE91_10340 [Pasteurella multocida]HDR1500993.1 hypothetical protein [Pasteurella multocida]